MKRPRRITEVYLKTFNEELYESRKENIKILGYKKYKKLQGLYLYMERVGQY